MAPVDEQGEGLVGVAGDHFDHGAWFDAEAVEILEQASVAFEYTDDRGLTRGGEFVKGDKTAAVAVLLRLQAEGETVGAVFVFAELFGEFGFKVGGDGVFHLLGFVVDFVPLHIEDFGEHALNEIVAADEAFGDFAAGCSKGDAAFAGYFDEAVAAEAPGGHSDGGRGYVKPAGERGGDDNLTFGFGFGDGLEVVFFRDRDAHALLF